MDQFDENDLKLLMSLLEPTKFADPALKIEEGLLNMKLDDEVKLELCRLLHSVCDYILRYGIESFISFSNEFVSNLQADQKKRYLELKEAVLPSALMARKTKEFRCPARDQMQLLIHYKSEDHKNIDIEEDLKLCLNNFTDLMRNVMRIKDKELAQDDAPDTTQSRSFFSKLFRLLFYSDYDNITNVNTLDETNSGLIDSVEHESLASEYLSGAVIEGTTESKFKQKQKERKHF